MTGSNRVVTVSTIRDDISRVARFLRRNLGSGVDHAIIFLDGPQPQLMEYLRRQERVTVLPTGRDYWAGTRPRRVVDRQMINANLACCALAGVDSVRWLFHIDADEALALDKAALSSSEACAVRVPTAEAVARRTWRRNEPRWFKRRPKPGQLHALAALGLIDEPEEEKFFRSHRLGKTGVRPASDVRFRIHTAYRLPEDDLEVEVLRGMYLLHYESATFNDFLNRWRHYQPGHASAQPFKDRQLGAAFYALATSRHVNDATRKQMLSELFDRHVADEVNTLRQLGLLVENPLHPVDPDPLPADDVALMREQLRRLAAEPKDDFRSSMLEAPRSSERSVS